MGLFKKLFKKNKEQLPVEVQEPVWDESIIRRSNIEIHNPQQRDKYVESCLEQIRDVEKEVVNLSFEYNLVTSYLKDMEEIEGLPKVERIQINDCAKRIEQLNQESRDYKRRKNALTDAMYRKIQRIEESMPEGYDKLKDAENYQMLVKQDLTKLDGERHAYQYRKEELKAAINNSNGMTMISIVTLGICIFLLAILQFALGLNVKIGYILSIGAAAVTITVVFLRSTEYHKEYESVENGINKLILLQNKVKIRYINNTHLLEYLRVKYDVKNSGELKWLWDHYQLEREQRESYEKTKTELRIYENDLERILSHYHISDPQIWFHQVAALIDAKEMVEIRHRLIIRRQKLRKQVEYNKEIAASAQDEIKGLVEDYPQYANEILKKVSRYEEQSR